MKKWSKALSEKYKRMSLKKMYYLLFLTFIVIPIISVLVLSLLILNKQFKDQAIENIQQSQGAVIAELTSDIEVMSMRLANLIYANDGEILSYAAATDTDDSTVRYENMEKLERAEKLSLEPVKDIVSIYFYMKDGKSAYLKNYINLSIEDVRQEKWYQNALASPNRICVGAYDTNNSDKLYSDSSNNMLVLAFSMAPDVTVDRTQKIEMVTLYQSSGAGTRIKNNNLDYAAGKNSFGISQIVDAEGNVVYSSVDENEWEGKNGYTCITTPVDVFNETWYIENYVKTSKLTEEYRGVAMWILLVAVAVFAFVIYFSRFFLKSIVKPMEAVNQGLKLVEDGQLDVHIDPAGQYEVRNMIHQFNAMVRRLRALIQEYENKMRSVGKAPEDDLKNMLAGDMAPEQVALESSVFFRDPYLLIGIIVDYYGSQSDERELSKKIIKGFERNARFASNCYICAQSTRNFVIYCRASDELYFSKTKRMLEELFRMTFAESGVLLYSCVGALKKDCAGFYESLDEIWNKLKLRHLGGKNTILFLENEAETYDVEMGNWVLEHDWEYEKLAEALFIADEKNLVQEKERLFEVLNHVDGRRGKWYALAAIVAIGERFGRDLSSFADLFGKHYNYIDKIDRIIDNKELKIWLTNYFSWVMDYTSSKLDQVETDAIVKAKRYITDHYDDPDLSLAQVADYVELNEKYFTNKFTKEAGETFSDYLTGIRMQKAKELLRTTSFKVYEIAEMVGYKNVTHFNRMFKKVNDISPMQYRKE